MAEKRGAHENEISKDNIKIEDTSVSTLESSQETPENLNVYEMQDLVHVFDNSINQPVNTPTTRKRKMNDIYSDINNTTQSIIKSYKIKEDMKQILFQKKMKMLESETDRNIAEMNLAVKRMQWERERHDALQQNTADLHAAKMKLLAKEKQYWERDEKSKK